MTNLLTKAFEKASALPEDLQDQLAEEFLEEMDWERRWDQTLAKSPDLIDRLADRAEENFRAGKSVEMGFDEL
jgi:hypothetical protein